jgi:hypothetical protein
MFSRVARLANGDAESTEFYKKYFGKITSARTKKVTNNVQKTKYALVYETFRSITNDISRNNLNAANYKFDCKCTEDTATLPNVK